MALIHCFTFVRLDSPTLDLDVDCEPVLGRGLAYLTIEPSKKSYVKSGSDMGGLDMRARIIGTLPLEDRVEDPHQLVGHMREGHQMVFAPRPLAVINRPKHRIEATGGQRGMPDGPAKGGRPPLAHLGLARGQAGLMQLLSS